MYSLPSFIRPLLLAALVPHATGLALPPSSGVSPRQDTSGMPRPKIGSVPYGVDITTCNRPNMVAITFDDGPCPYTPTLLDILDKNNVKATFFLVGSNGNGVITDESTGMPATLRRMHAAGHHIGSHTWTHADLNTLSTEQRRVEVENNEAAIAAVLGFVPTYLRPPYTSCDAGCMADLGDFGYHVADYNIDTLDWEGDYDRARSIYSGALSGADPKTSSFISLEHDIHERTVNELAQYLIDTARQYGYQLVTMGECLGDPDSNWYRNPTTGLAWK
ncbi:chitin deacetylase [Apiospora rasikravindrae]|uniref:Chitin deacetylase n=1 Tax=Apiospora rasikravindrae TaxID=990691 RepID=A0ABR1S4Y2_9PEZI